MEDAGQELLRAAAASFEQQKLAVEKALAQLTDEQIRWQPDAESNSITVLVQHLAGSLRSRWRELLTSDGEKPDRDRDAEFEDQGLARDRLLQAWHAAWEIQRAELARLTPADLLRTTHARGRPETVVAVLVRQLAHLAGHAGQIIYIAKQLRGADWQTLSIARGTSREYTERLMRGG